MATVKTSLEIKDWMYDKLVSTEKAEKKWISADEVKKDVIDFIIYDIAVLFGKLSALTNDPERFNKEALMKMQSRWLKKLGIDE